MAKKRKKVSAELGTAEEIAEMLLNSPAFKGVIEKAISHYSETKGTCDAVNIVVTIISDGVNSPTLAVAADRFNLYHPDE